MARNLPSDDRGNISPSSASHHRHTGRLSALHGQHNLSTVPRALLHSHDDDDPRRAGFAHPSSRSHSRRTQVAQDELEDSPFTPRPPRSSASQPYPPPLRRDLSRSLSPGFHRAPYPVSHANQCVYCGFACRCLQSRLDPPASDVLSLADSRPSTSDAHASLL